MPVKGSFPLPTLRTPLSSGIDSRACIIQVEQVSALQVLLDEIISSISVANLTAFCARVLAEDVAQHVTKNLILSFARAIKTIRGEEYEEVANFAVGAIRQHVNAFDEADTILREGLFEYYINCEEYKQGAQVLGGINFDSSTRVFTESEKVDIHVKCAEACLAADETVDAETFVNKASSLINSIDDCTLQLRYRAAYARILDATRKFVEAASRYYDLSITSNPIVDQGDLLELLGKAVTCAVLGKAGPQRSRVLAVLYKDERLASLEQLPQFASHPAILAKMHTEQLLLGDEMSTFEASLMPHQRAVTSEGYTIPEKAVIEHNMLATARLYDNICFSELANILRMTPRNAEKVAAKMITEGRLKGSIDQTEGILFFEEEANPLVSWDESIGVLCDEVSKCVDLIEQKFALMEE